MQIVINTKLFVMRSERDRMFYQGLASGAHLLQVKEQLF
jgi:hypothetical protein